VLSGERIGLTNITRKDLLIANESLFAGFSGTLGARRSSFLQEVFEPTAFFDEY
jgi:hypothetical protein